LELTEIRSWNFGNSSLSESTGSNKHIGVGIGRVRQIIVLLNVEQVEGKIEERSQKASEKLVAPTFTQTAIECFRT
jgi:hypothetical protein